MATTPANLNPLRYVTPAAHPVRFGFTKNTLQPSEKGKYEMMILIPKTDTETVNGIKKAMEACKLEPKSLATWGSKWLASMKSPLRDGDTERDTEARPEYKGHWFVNLNTNNMPDALDGTKPGTPKLQASDLYSGCHGRVALTVSAYNVDGNKGIKCYLSSLIKTGEGERLAGGGSAAADFGVTTAAAEDFLS